MLGEVVIGEFQKYKSELEKEEERSGVSKEKRKNQEQRNLTAKERRGLKKLRKRIGEEEIVCLKTDKSGKLTLMNREEYLKLGREDSRKDKEISGGEMRAIERNINGHTRMWAKIINAGESHNHFSRIVNSKIIESEVAANKYMMYKDHKKGGGWRPVVSGCSSNTLGLSNLLSDIIESVCQSISNPFEVISSEDMLAHLNKFNKEVEEKRKQNPEYYWREDFVLLGTDVTALFPSLSAEKTGRAVRLQVEKSDMIWEELDEIWLSLYIRLNRDLCSNLGEIEHLLPVRQKGRRGKEAGINSEECKQRKIKVNSKESNWEFPKVIIGRKEKKKLIAAALEIGVKWFFRNFTYTFGGKLYLQLDGGPIGARLTMCVAKLVLQQWKEEYDILLKDANLEEKLSKIYVDDNRCITQKIKSGLRFDEEEKKFKFKEEWRKEDDLVDIVERTKRELLKAMNAINSDLKFTMEHENDFTNQRLPTLSFEIWSTLNGVRHSYFEKSMRSQILTQKRSSQSETSKFAILTNELRRRFAMMDEGIEKEEKVEKIDKFTQQMINSGYSWQQTREVVIASLKGVLKEEERRKESNLKRYRTGAESLEDRIKKKMTQNTQWYKKQREDGEEEIETRKEGEEKVRSWKEWRRGRRRTTNQELNFSKKVVKDDPLEGIMFVPHTERSTLAKRIREKLEMLSKISSLSVRVVERSGEKVEDILHKSNPWDGEPCGREGCIFCESEDKKMWGRCKQRNVVYENECMTCTEGEEEKLLINGENGENKYIANKDAEVGGEAERDSDEEKKKRKRDTVIKEEKEASRESR